MTPSLAADLLRSALWLGFQVGAPLLGTVTLAAVIFGVLQAATQVQDSAVSFTPKLVVALLVTWFSAAWFASTLSGFMHKVLEAIPWVVAR
jgi:flagellar biosynthesis protein FliQ